MLRTTRSRRLVLVVVVALVALVAAGTVLALSNSFTPLYGDKARPDEIYTITITDTATDGYTATVEIEMGNGPDGVWYDSIGRLGVRDGSAEWLACPECSVLRCDRVGDSLFCGCPCTGPLCRAVSPTGYSLATATPTPTAQITPTPKPGATSTPAPTATWTPFPTPPTPTAIWTPTAQPTDIPRCYMIHHESQGPGDGSWDKCMPIEAWNGHQHHKGDTLGSACECPGQGQH